MAFSILKLKSSEVLNKYTGLEGDMLCPNGFQLRRDLKEIEKLLEEKAAPEDYMVYGLLSGLNNDYESMKFGYENALCLSQDSRIYYNYGVSLRRLNHFDAAAEKFQTSYQLKPNDHTKGAWVSVLLCSWELEEAISVLNMDESASSDIESLRNVLNHIRYMVDSGGLAEELVRDFIYTCFKYLKEQKLLFFFSPGLMNDSESYWLHYSIDIFNEISLDKLEEINFELASILADYTQKGNLDSISIDASLKYAH